MSSRLVLATVCLVAALIGGNFTAIKFALDHTSPLMLTAMRTVIGGSFLLAFAHLRGERLPRRAVDLGNIFAVSLSISTLSSALLVFGTSRVPAGVASLLSSTAPLFTVVLSAVLLSAGVTHLGALGLLVGFTGTIVLATPSLGGETATIGILSMTASALTWAFGMVYMKWKDFSRVSPVMLVGVQLIMSACMLVPVALVVEGTGDTDWSPGLFVPLAYAAVPALAVTFALLATVVVRATPTQASATAYLIPAFGVFFGWLFRDEVLGRVEMLGGLLVAVGVFVVVTSAARQAEHALPETSPRSASSR